MHRLSRLRLYALTSLLTTASLWNSGCSLFRPQDDAMAAYEMSRREINGEMVNNPESDDRLGLADFSPDNISSTFKKATGNGPNPTLAKREYAEAEAVYRQAAQLQGDQRAREFERSAAMFEAAASRWPDSTLRQDALYWAGQGFFFADQYPKANDTFELLIKEYPNSKYIDQIAARRFSVAMYWADLAELQPESFYYVNWSDEKRPWRDTYGNAIRIFDRIRFDDPRGKLADDATMAAGNAYFRAGKFMKADEFYTDLRKTFPNSEHQFLGHFLGVQAKLKSYQGPDYSEDALVEADKIIKQINRQFPHQAAKHRDYLGRAAAETRFLMAERRWKRAQYYRRLGQNRAAGMSYRQLLDEFADTPFAQQAQIELAQVATEPPKPPQRLSWLVNAFPSHEDTKPLIATAPANTRR
ncbi:MAG: tetratricopeptide repeat protein [Pirellulaceae bacterium]|jgi:outer membrane protein assembly factor BamD (BamD/ComL family)|nr:tetratricopeptide repeat protein [Pirellulaceae bacterium]